MASPKLCALCRKELTGRRKKFCSTSCTRELARRTQAASRAAREAGRPKVLRVERRMIHGQEVDVTVLEAAEGASATKPT